MAVVLGTSAGFVTTAPSADPGGGDTTIDGSSVVVKDTSPAGAYKITQIGWYRGSGTNTANFEVALYADGSGVATTRLFVDATNSSAAGGWITVAVDWDILPSTPYWLGLQMDAHTGSSTVDNATSGGSGTDVRTSQTTLNDPYGGGAVADADGMYAIYALVNKTPTVALNSPADASSDSDTTPTLDFTGTDPEGDSIEYEVQIHTDNGFSDPKTFGYTTHGAQTPLGPSQDKFFGTRFTSPSDISQITSASVSICSDLGTPSGKIVIVKASDLTIVSNGVSNAFTIPFEADQHPADFTTATFSTPPTLSPSTDYILGVIHNDAAFSVYVEWDTGTSNYYYFDSSNSYTTPTNPTDAVTTGDDNSGPNNAKLSIYVTYSPVVLIDAVSETDAGFVNPDTGGDTHPFNSGENIQYTVQGGDALAADTYYWRVRGIDTAGTNVYGDWSSTRSFTVTAGGGTVVKDMISGFIPFAR